MSKVIVILNAAFAVLTTPPIRDVEAYRQRSWPVSPKNFVASINVKLGRKLPPELKTGPNTHLGIADRTTELLVQISARGNNALEEVERLSSEIARRLFSDTTFGGVCIGIDDIGAMRNEDDADGAMQMLTMVFAVKYRTFGDET